MKLSCRMVCTTLLTLLGIPVLAEESTNLRLYVSDASGCIDPQTLQAEIAAVVGADGATDGLLVGVQVVAEDAVDRRRIAVSMDNVVQGRRLLDRTLEFDAGECHDAERVLARIVGRAIQKGSVETKALLETAEPEPTTVPQGEHREPGEWQSLCASRIDLPEDATPSDVYRQCVVFLADENRLTTMPVSASGYQYGAHPGLTYGTAWIPVNVPVIFSYQGEDKHPLKGEEFYTAVGRADLAQRYLENDERETSLRARYLLAGLGLAAVMGALSIAGLVAGVAMAGGGTVWLLSFASAPTFTTLMVWLIAASVLLGIGLAVGLGGLSGLLASPLALVLPYSAAFSLGKGRNDIPGYRSPHPVPLDQRRQLAREHNDNLAQELGLRREDVREINRSLGAF